MGLVDKRMSRRQFVGGAAAALAAPMVVPSSVIGAEGQTPPSDRICMAGIGHGNMGSGDLGSLINNRDVQYLAFCDVRPDKLAAAVAVINKKNGNQDCKAYKEFEEIAARKDIDAVQSSTPDHWHALIAVAMMRSGKDMYSQKPMSLTIREARVMINTCRRYGRVFQTGSQQRSSSEFYKACMLVRNECIGKLQKVYVNVGGTSQDKVFPEEPIPEGFDWNRWLGPAPWRPYNGEACSGNYGGGFRQVRDFSGGMMTDWGAHHFDIAQWGIGADDTGPVEITPPGGEVKKLTYKYANGVILRHTDKTDDGQGVDGVLFEGTEGRKVQVNRGKIKTWPEELLKDTKYEELKVQLYKSNNHYRNFLDCVKTRQRPICDVSVGGHSVTVCHLGNIAYWLKRPLKWDPEKEEFVGDAEANRWLDRPKRAPWTL
jgi:predicted dehydrogenase